MGEDSSGNQNRKYIKCCINKTEESFRSPWTNQYFPKEPEDKRGYPSSKLRELESEANELFKDYVLQYKKNLNEIWQKLNRKRKINI